MRAELLLGAETPLVSIAMPVRNCEATLEPALRSILLQTLAAWELLLIDDGSDDRTLEIARSFPDRRVRIVSDGQKRGLPNRLNQAVAMSRGRYVARMDGDDVSYPQRLEKQVTFLEAHREVDLVGTWVVVFRSNGAALGKRAPFVEHAQITARPFAGFPVAHPTYCGRVGWFRRYGYREEAWREEDQDLLLRSYSSSRFANLGEILLGYREERIKLSSMVTARRNYGRSVALEFLRQRRPFLALWAVAGQAAKAAVDTVAVATRLEYHLLRHRARRITEEEECAWRWVWRSVQAEAVLGVGR
jgi:glycosyltransferase involved in cell wall biosynthesis